MDQINARFWSVVFVRPTTPIHGDLFDQGEGRQTGARERVISIQQPVSTFWDHAVERAKYRGVFTPFWVDRAAAPWSFGATTRLSRLVISVV
jgi:hypothetical protein